MRLYCERTMGGEHKTSDPINGSKAGQKSRSRRLGTRNAPGSGDRLGRNVPSVALASYGPDTAIWEVSGCQCLNETLLLP